MYHFNVSLLCNKLDVPSLLVFTWLGTVGGSVKALPKSVLRQPVSVGYQSNDNTGKHMLTNKGHHYGNNKGLKQLDIEITVYQPQYFSSVYVGKLKCKHEQFKLPPSLFY